MLQNEKKKKKKTITNMLKNDFLGITTLKTPKTRQRRIQHHVRFKRNGMYKQSTMTLIT